ncbi:hypothetical protein JCM8097_001838 [Rhodosporidiobolus ruineniae]
MHATLPTHVLALAPDSLAALGDLDHDALSEIWGVFTRCKDSLQNGRRLENLSWRLLFVSSGRRGSPLLDHPPTPDTADHLTPERVDQIKQHTAQQGLSDPESDWEETSDDDSEAVEEEEDNDEDGPARGRLPEPTPRLNAISPPKASQPPRGRTASVPAAPSPGKAEAVAAAAGGGGGVGPQRPPFRRGGSREWKSAPVIKGCSLQQLIADLQRMPEIPPLGKARSLHEVSATTKPPLGSRGSSAPDGLSQASLSRSVTPPLPSVEAVERGLGETTPNRSRRASSPDARSPCMSRSASTPNHPTTSTSMVSVIAPTPSPTPSTSSAHRRVPSALTMSAMPAAIRTSRPPSPSPPTREQQQGLRLTPTETAMLALSNSRNQSDANLSRRSQSTAELAASFKPQSFVRGFNPSPSSLEARPRPGSIAPPPTPAGQAVSLAPSPPKAKTPASSPASVVPPSALRSAATPAKVPPPRPAAFSSSSAAPAPTPGPSKPSAMKAPGTTGKKIFFISSPESDEDHSSRSRESRGGARVVITPPTVSKPALSAKGKAPAVQADDDEGDWDSDEEEEDDDDASSGWGSDYSTESDIARNSAAKAPVSRSGPAGSGRPALDFTRRQPSELARTASTASMGQPGELKPRPPGLLSQLFHPDQFVDPADVERPHSAAGATEMLRRNHKSMSALPTLGQLRATKSSVALNDPRKLAAANRSKSFLRGKPEDVELESSSDEEGDDEDESAAQQQEQQEQALSVPPSRDEKSSDYEDVDDDASSSAESAAALLARRQRLAAELEAQNAVLAPPQTPRTTRRAMLATELSESLRRNLLWERQTRNRVMGGAAPRRPVVPGQPLPQRPASSAQLAPPPPVPSAPLTSAAAAADAGLRAPHPSPATRQSPPISRAAAAANGTGAPPAPPPTAGLPPRRSASFVNLPRRHTTGTGLYLAAQTNNWGRPLRAAESDSELSQSEDEGDEEDEQPAQVLGGGNERVW